MATVKQTSDEQALINGVVQLKRDQLKAMLH